MTPNEKTRSASLYWSTLPRGRDLPRGRGRLLLYRVTAASPAISNPPRSLATGGNPRRAVWESTSWTNYINKLFQHELRAVGAGWHLDGSRVLAKWCTSRRCRRCRAVFKLQRQDAGARLNREEAELDRTAESSLSSQRCLLLHGAAAVGR